jgi:hypothetical protein
MSIEAIVREAEAERAQVAQAYQQKEIDQNKKRDQEHAQNILEANAAFVALDECGVRLQALYDHSSRSIKDKLWTVIQQIINSKEELRQVYRDKETA